MCTQAWEEYARLKLIFIFTWLIMRTLQRGLRLCALPKADITKHSYFLIWLGQPQNVVVLIYKKSDLMHNRQNIFNKGKFQMIHLYTLVSLIFIHLEFTWLRFLIFKNYSSYDTAMLKSEEIKSWGGGGKGDFTLKILAQLSMSIHNAYFRRTIRVRRG